MNHNDVARAAQLIRQANALLICAGAGMGVDSGLPDFRGTQGFWKAYPPFAQLGLSFVQLANPRWFQQDPELAWGFYGHRLMLYRQTPPHQGFSILKRWSEHCPNGSFVFTSNVDGHFQKAGFSPDQVYEVHGSLNHVQCLKQCGLGIVPADHITLEIDPATFRAKPPLPSCPQCHGLLRPNVLMFGDGGWESQRSEAQDHRLNAWLAETQPGQVVIIEIGAGENVPTVRLFTESMTVLGTLIRINPRDFLVPRGHVFLPVGGLEALQAIDQIMCE